IQVDEGEQCDLNNLNGATCGDWGVEYGTPICNSECELDPKGCYWFSLMGPVGHTAMYRIRMTPDGQYIYAAGETSVGFYEPTSSPQAVVMKLTRDGTVVWIGEWGEPGNSTMEYVHFAMELLPGGNVVFAGNLYTYLNGDIINGDSNLFIAELTSDGTPLWETHFGQSDRDESIWGLTRVSSGNIYVYGVTDGSFPGFTNLGDYDLFLTASTADGSLLWTFQWGTDMYEYPGFNGTDRDETGIYVGAQTGYDPGEGSLHIRKFTLDGSPLWELNYLTVGQSVPTASCAHDDGDLVVVGFSPEILPGATLASTPGHAAFIMKLSPEGEVRWITQWGTGRMIEPRGCAVAENGDVVITGRAMGEFPGYSNLDSTKWDSFASRFTEGGTYLWSRQWGELSGNWDQFTSNPVLDSNGNMYVMGVTYGTMPGSFNMGTGGVFLMQAYIE
ncbi:hypothetical protein KJ865_17045, partial [Myxococcota bacterium]|nr:hypothetical protein [Myxococcota bacterium]